MVASSPSRYLILGIGRAAGDDEGRPREGSVAVPGWRPKRCSSGSVRGGGVRVPSSAGSGESAVVDARAGGLADWCCRARSSWPRPRSARRMVSGSGQPLCRDGQGLAIPCLGSRSPSSCRASMASRVRMVWRCSGGLSLSTRQTPLAWGDAKRGLPKPAAAARHPAVWPGTLPCGRQPSPAGEPGAACSRAL